MNSQKVPRPVIARNGATKQSNKMEYKFNKLEMVRLLRSARNDLLEIVNLALRNIFHC
jgi:hypothetical protein